MLFSLSVNGNNREVKCYLESDNWIVQNLNNALETWNSKLSEIWQLLTQSPETFKGGDIWSVMLTIRSGYTKEVPTLKDLYRQLMLQEEPEARALALSVKDIGILLQYALKNQTFNDIFQSKSYFVAPTDQHLSGFTFYSSMFKLRDQWELDEGEIVGGKTGYTDEAGLCLASEAIVNGRKYIAITVNAEGNHNTEPFHVNDAFYLYNQLQSQ